MSDPALDRRGYRIGGRTENGGNRRKTHCHRGHDLASAYVYEDGHRVCRTCTQERQRARYRRQQADQRSTGGVA